MAGPWLKSDVVEVYAFRDAGDGVEFLQLLRADGEHGGRLARTWQPMMGHIDGNETAVQTAERELREEVGLTRQDPAFLGLWALNSVRPYYMHARNIIMMSPCFAARVDAGWTPTLNEEHTAFRWVPASEVPARFMWPGQVAAAAEITATIARRGWEGEPIVRVWKR
jgi:dATP pyrophosphohydrolase